MPTQTTLRSPSPQRSLRGSPQLAVALNPDHSARPPHGPLAVGTAPAPESSPILDLGTSLLARSWDRALITALGPHPSVCVLAWRSSTRLLQPACRPAGCPPQLPAAPLDWAAFLGWFGPSVISGPSAPCC